METEKIKELAKAGKTAELIELVRSNRNLSNYLIYGGRDVAYEAMRAGHIDTMMAIIKLGCSLQIKENIANFVDGNILVGIFFPQSPEAATMPKLADIGYPDLDEINIHDCMCKYETQAMQCKIAIEFMPFERLEEYLEREFILPSIPHPCVCFKGETIEATDVIISELAANNRTHDMIYMFKKYGIKHSRTVVDNFAQYLINSGCLEHAAELFNMGFPRDKCIPYKMAITGNTELMLCAVKYGCEWDSCLTSAAVEFGHYETAIAAANPPDPDIPPCPLTNFHYMRSRVSYSKIPIEYVIKLSQNDIISARDAFHNAINFDKTGERIKEFIQHGYILTNEDIAISIIRELNTFNSVNYEQTDLLFKNCINPSGREILENVANNENYYPLRSIFKAETYCDKYNIAVEKDDIQHAMFIASLKAEIKPDLQDIVKEGYDLDPRCAIVMAGKGQDEEMIYALRQGCIAKGVISEAAGNGLSSTVSAAYNEIGKWDEDTALRAYEYSEEMLLDVIRKGCPISAELIKKLPSRLFNEVCDELNYVHNISQIGEGIRDIEQLEDFDYIPGLADRLAKVIVESGNWTDKQIINSFVAALSQF